MQAINSSCITVPLPLFLSLSVSFWFVFAFVFVLGRLIKNLVQYSPQSPADAAHLLLLWLWHGSSSIFSRSSSWLWLWPALCADHDKCKKQFIAHLTQFSFFMSSRAGAERQRGAGKEGACLGARLPGKQSFADTHAPCRMLPAPSSMHHEPIDRAPWNVDHGPRTVDRGPRMVQRNSILDFMCDKYEVQTFLCSSNFYAAFVFVVERIEDAPRP